MMSKSTDEILAAMTPQEQYASAPLDFAPTVEGYVLPQSPSSAIQSGSFNQVPMISGTNHDEGRLLTAIGMDDAITPIVLDDTTYAQAVAQALDNEFPGLGQLPGAGIPLILPLYPLSDYQSQVTAGYDPNVEPAHLAASAMSTDTVFSCYELLDSDMLAAAGTDLYVYEFNDPNAPMTVASPYMPLGAAHTAELVYVFQGALQNGSGSSAAGFTPDQQALSDQMQTYWTNFAKTGDPNGAGLPTWPKYTGSSGKLLTLAPGSNGTRATRVSAFSRFHKCGVWDLLLTPTLGL
jgi:para-nitrobenzyl esterase